MMKNQFFLLIFIAFIFSCSTQRNISISYVDEYIFQDSLVFQNAIIGGLSGIDYVNNNFYFPVDDSNNPRILVGKIILENDKISTIEFEKTIFLNDANTAFYIENELDLESIFVDETTNEINLVSEGSIRKGKMPTIFSVDENGKFIEQFQLPTSFSNIEAIKHNAVFESSSKSVDHQGFWVAMESPLSFDGEHPTFEKQSSPIRITYFDKKSKIATKQFAYQLENIPKPYKGNQNINGATAILEIQKNQFLIVERAYQNNYGSQGNTIRIFEAVIDENTTNIIKISSLKETPFVPLKKRLLFDFDSVKDSLIEGFIDNIEGITLGPKLKNGNQSLILVADDNFQTFGKQLNQFILLEIKTNK